jgi:hypothetical protein
MWDTRQAQIVSGGTAAFFSPVIEAVGILWSDLCKPERIVETLRVLGKKPLFPVPEFQLI